MRQNKLVMIPVFAGFSLAIAVCALFLWDMFPKNAFESRVIDKNDPYYNIVMQKMNSEHSDYLIASRGKIALLKISANKYVCIFVSANPPVAFNDNDILYCFDKETGNFVEQI